jgi:hypothetical protein
MDEEDDNVDVFELLFRIRDFNECGSVFGIGIE